MTEKYCKGCGILLQDENMLQEGYTTSIENDICQRCFRMKNYGEYQVVTRSNEEYIDILKEVGKTKDLVLYIADLFNLEEDLSYIREYIPNKMILVLNKRDVLPKSVRTEKIVHYMKERCPFFVDILVISAHKNDFLDSLLKTIKYHQTSKNVYVVGHTNAGKSTLINKMIQNYSTNSNELTISPLPSTTLNKIQIDLDEYLTLIDTPGLVDRGNIVNYLEKDELKKLNPKKEIKPKTYQIKAGQCLLLGEYARIDYIEGEKNSFTVYTSNEVKVTRLVMARHEDLKNLYKRTYDVKFDEDLVINGLGWIKIVNPARVDLYVNQNVKTFPRKSLI